MPLLLTAAGPGAPGEVVPPDPPEAPTNLLVSSITTSGATLSWTAPVSGGAPDGYDVEVQVAGGDWSSPVFTGTSGTTSKAVTGLASGTDYDARVRAYNSAGDSAWLELEPAFTTGALPVNTVAPSISGTAQQGQTLTRATGTWTGTATITYTQQWKRYTTGGVFVENISGATGTTYELTAGDVGYKIGVSVTGSNAYGSASADSALTAEVTAASSWVPTDVAGLQYWQNAGTASSFLDSGGAPASDGENVATVEDQSGEAHNATQGSSGSRPVFTLADAHFNNRCSLDFDGANDSLLSALGSISGALTVLACLRLDTTKHQYIFDSGNTNEAAMLASDGTFGTGFAVYASTAGTPALTTAPLATTLVVCWKFNGDGTGTFYKNGTGYNFTCGTNALTNFRIGSTGNGANSFLDGRLSDILVYNSALGNTDRANAESYLATANGVTL